LPNNSGCFAHFCLNDHYNCNTYGKSEQCIKFASSTAVTNAVFARIISHISARNVCKRLVCCCGLILTTNVSCLNIQNQISGKSVNIYPLILRVCLCVDLIKFRSFSNTELQVYVIMNHNDENTNNMGVVFNATDFYISLGFR